MKTMKMILSWILWLGRGTATVMGLAMLLAITLSLGNGRSRVAEDLTPGAEQVAPDLERKVPF
jgi:hypothetical protein